QMCIRDRKYLSDHPKLQGIAQQNSFKHT
ncbi:hypothetical protein, partial [Escherichia coli]